MSSSKDTLKETPLSVLARTNLTRYLDERTKLATANAPRSEFSSGPDALRGLKPVLLDSQSQTFMDALVLMQSVQVQAMPLVRYRNQPNGAYDALCFLSVGDLVSTLIDAVDKADIDASRVLPAMGRLAAVGLELESLPLKKCRTKWDGTVLWRAAAMTHTLADALQICLYISHQSLPGSMQLRQCPHRFAVMNDDNFITHVVSQSDMVMYLHTNRDLITELFTNATIADLGLCNTVGVVTIGASTPTVDCFREMERHRVGAVAVVDEQSRVLLGTLSESDITHLHGGASFASLALPVGEFLLHSRPDVSPWMPSDVDRVAPVNPKSSAYAVVLSRHARSFVVSCRPSDTLTDVLTSMDVRAVHRVWVVNDANCVVGVVALADVLAVVARFGMSVEEAQRARDAMVVA